MHVYLDAAKCCLAYCSQACRGQRGRPQEMLAYLGRLVELAADELPLVGLVFLHGGEEGGSLFGVELGIVHVLRPASDCGTTG
jgi:hypothetical protein